MDSEEHESYTGGSSPFVDTPSTHGNDEHNISEEKATTNRNTDATNESAQENRILSLQYKLDTQRNEFELEKLQLQRKYNDLERKYNSTLEELETSNGDISFIKGEEEKLKEEVRNLQTKYTQLEHESENQIHDLQQNMQEKQRVIAEITLDNEEKINKLQNDIENNRITTENLETTIARYESMIKEQSNKVLHLTEENDKKDSELISLKRKVLTLDHDNFSGDDEKAVSNPNNTNTMEELTTVNRMFQEQIKYTTELEGTNMEQAEKIKTLENASEMSNYWKSEIDSLQNKLQGFESLEKDYQDSQLEMLELKSKLAEWEIYKNNDGENDEGQKEEHLGEDKDLTDGTPAETIRDLTLTKKENIILIDENNKLNISVNNLKILNEELAMERNQLLDLNKNYENSIINLKRLNHEYEQQKILSSEECKLLRRQLDEFTEFNKKNTKAELGMNPSVESSHNDNNNNKESIQSSLETLVDDYKNKTDDLTNELKKLNDQLLSSTEEEQKQNKKRRKLTDESQVTNLTYYSQRINELQLENAKLNRDLAKYQNLNKLLDEKLKRLIMLKEKKIRILQLRDNPLANDQFIKKKQLEFLQQENKDLLEKLYSSSLSTDLKTVPISVVKSMEFDLKQRDKEVFKSNKRFTRLKEIFNKKSLEFIEVVNSILGFKLEFQQNNKVKIYSCFRPDKYLVVDLVQNTLVSNLKLDNWDELLSIWIEERGQIPCFLATITLQLWEENSK